MSLERDKNSHLITAEMSEEGNYNMVGDGIINNVSKPSIIERLREFESQKAESIADFTAKSGKSTNQER